jgi:hypothetical protein
MFQYKVNHKETVYNNFVSAISQYGPVMDSSEQDNKPLVSIKIVDLFTILAAFKFQKPVI